MQFHHLTTLLLATLATAAPLPNTNDLSTRQLPATGGLPAVPGTEMVTGLLSPVTGALGGLGGLVKRQGLPSMGSLPGLNEVTGILGSVTGGGLPGLVKKEVPGLSLVGGLLNGVTSAAGSSAGKSGGIL